VRGARRDRPGAVSVVVLATLDPLEPALQVKSGRGEAVAVEIGLGQAEMDVGAGCLIAVLGGGGP
jgi:hypothetical protein